MAVMMKKSSDNDREEFRLVLERAKEAIEPRYLLDSLGFKTSRETSKEIRGSCVIHGGDNMTSFRFNKETKTWVCFSHRCHEIFGNDIIGLIKGVSGVGFMDAVDKLKSMTGDLSGSSYADFKRKKERQAFIRSHKRVRPKSSIVTEDCLRQFKPFRSQFFNHQGFSNETLDFFEIAGGYTDNHGYIRDVIPIRDVKGNLVAYSMRDIREDISYDFKYVHTEGFDKDKVIYNLNNAKEHIKDKPLIVVEGFKSVWCLHQMGIKNVAAVMGAHITQGQQNLLYSYASSGVVLFFDCDAAGASGMIKAMESFGSKLDVTPIFITEDGKDPADLDVESLFGYLAGYIDEEVDK